MGSRKAHSPGRARPAARDREAVSGPRFVVFATALIFALLAGLPQRPLAAQELSDGGETPRLRLGEGVAAANDPFVVLPVYTRYADTADGVQLTLDFDRSRLRFESIQTLDDLWQPQPAVVHLDGRVTIDLRFYGKLDADARSRDTEAVYLRFALLPPPDEPQEAGGEEDRTPAEEPFRRRFPVTLSEGEGPAGSFFYLRPAQTKQAVPGTISGGQLVVFHRSGFEIGWGALTNVANSFSLPVYLTYIGDDSPTTLATGIDYDELFLTCTGVEGIAPPLTSTDLELQTSDGDSSAGNKRIDLEFEPDALNGSVLRLQVATMHFRYNGGLSRGDELIINAILLSIDGEPLPEPQDEGAGGGDGQALGLGSEDGRSGSPGVVRFLPTYFVRGNVDSSHQRRETGTVTYLPDVSDIIRILSASFLDGGALPCNQAADADANGSVDVTDAILFLNHLFRTGIPPRSPYPDPGFALESEPDLGCDVPIPYFEAMPPEY